MGVTALWKTLRTIDVVDVLDGSQTLEIVRHIDGRAIAVDITIWMCEAMTQPNLKEVFSSDAARVLKVCFDRCVQWVRHGCIPVAVLEGDSPPEKLDEIQRRLNVRIEGWNAIASFDGQRGLALQSLNVKVLDLFEALGLPVIQAPGEAEATCAALQRHGMVYACATRDSDALVMGATRVFHTLRLNVALQRDNELQQCSLEKISRWLGLESGGSQALLLLALMVGGDYDSGTERVGPTTALKFIKHVLSGKRDDTCLLSDVEAMLQDNSCSEAETLAQATQCTGCKRCKHEGGRKGSIKKHTSKNLCSHPDCSECSHEEGFFCSFQDGPCKCKFHMSKSSREFLKVLEKLQERHFLQAAKSAEAAYLSQIREADNAVNAWKAATDIFQLEWLCRPDTAQVRDALTAGGSGLEYNLSTVERKLKPLLREWDITHPAKEAEYKPKRIVKVAGKAVGEGESDRRWAYLVDFLKNGKDDKVDDEGEAMLGATPGSKKPANSAPHTRFVRKSVICTFWGELVTAFEQQEARLAENRAKQSAKKKAKEELAASRLAREGKHKQTTLDSFFSKRKTPAVWPRPDPSGVAAIPRLSQAARAKPNNEAEINLCTPDSSICLSAGEADTEPNTLDVQRLESSPEIELSATDDNTESGSPPADCTSAGSIPAASEGFRELQQGHNSDKPPNTAAAPTVDSMVTWGTLSTSQETVNALTQGASLCSPPASKPPLAVDDSLPAVEEPLPPGGRSSPPRLDAPPPAWDAADLLGETAGGVPAPAPAASDRGNDASEFHSAEPGLRGSPEIHSAEPGLRGSPAPAEDTSTPGFQDAITQRLEDIDTPAVDGAYGQDFEAADSLDIDEPLDWTYDNHADEGDFLSLGESAEEEDYGMEASAGLDTPAEPCQDTRGIESRVETSADGFQDTRGFHSGVEAQPAEAETQAYLSCLESPERFCQGASTADVASDCDKLGPYASPDRCRSLLVSPSKRQKTPSNSRPSDLPCHTNWRIHRSKADTSPFEILLSSDDVFSEKMAHHLTHGEAGDCDEVRKRLAFGDDPPNTGAVLVGNSLPVACQREQITPAHTGNKDREGAIDLSPTP